MDILTKVAEVTKILDEIDAYFDNLPSLQSNNDLIISDLYHYIEHNKLDAKASYRMIKRLRENLLIRREYKEEYELLRVLKQHQNKLLQKENRKMLLSELGKAQKRLKSEYKYRILYENDIKEKLEA